LKNYVSGDWSLHKKGLDLSGRTSFLISCPSHLVNDRIRIELLIIIGYNKHHMGSPEHIALHEQIFKHDIGNKYLALDACYYVNNDTYRQQKLHNLHPLVFSNNPKQAFPLLADLINIEDSPSPKIVILKMRGAITMFTDTPPILEQFPLRDIIQWSIDHDLDFNAKKEGKKLKDQIHIGKDCPNPTVLADKGLLLLTIENLFRDMTTHSYGGEITIKPKESFVELITLSPGSLSEEALLKIGKESYSTRGWLHGFGKVSASQAVMMIQEQAGLPAVRPTWENISIDSNPFVRWTAQIPLS
jgi:hypothetical protein